MEGKYSVSHEFSINISEKNKNIINETENEENNDEKYINDSPKIISYARIKTIIEQMEKCICKIKVEENKYGTGFFCEIPFPDKKKMLPVLITNNHIINKFNANISLLKKKDKDWKNIKLLNDRYLYTNEAYDITIIEIKPIDENKNFLKLDKTLIDDIITEDSNFNAHLEGQTIYTIQYPEGELSVSFGILRKRMQDKEYEFLHSSSTSKGSSGSPILNLDNNVIGIHKGPADSNNNKGSFLNDALKEFIRINSKIENEKALDEFNKKYNKKIQDTEIDFLNLAHAFIQDVGFKELNKIEFKNVTNLNLEYNHITNLEPLIKNRMKNLVKLNLSNNSIKDIESLKKVNFKKLEELNLSANKISNIGIIEYLDLNKLKILNLGQNKKIKYINSLDKPEFKELIELNLEENIIDDIKVFENAKMEKLETLNLKKNKIKDIEAFKIAKFKGLKTLYLNGNNIKKISELNDVSFKTELMHLDISGNEIDSLTDLFYDDEQQSKFDKLKTFYAIKNYIPITDINQMKNMIKQKCPQIIDIKIEDQKKKNNK